MINSPRSVSRRQFLKQSAAVGAGVLAGPLARGAGSPPRPPARIAITLDCEMSANFPQWEDTHWNYEKGNLNEETKRYAVEAARRVKARGGTMHFFLVGQALEHENVDWLREILAGGHLVGNHTYDHVYLLAKTLDDVQARFRRAPWLIAGKTVAQAVRENIELATQAMRTRLGVSPAGFRTPGGFSTALHGREDLQRMLLDSGFSYVSSLSPTYPMPPSGQRPDQSIFDALVQRQARAQPFVYPTGLIEIPISPITDIGAFRNGRWPLEDFLEATRQGVSWAIEHGAVFDFVSHPSCLGVVDPEFRTIDLICDLVAKAGDRAAIVNLETIARHTRDAVKKSG